MGYKMMYTTLIVFNNESEFNKSFSFPDNEFENKNYFLNKLKIRKEEESFLFVSLGQVR